MRVLVLHYSQTGQLSAAVTAFTQTLQDNSEIEVVYARLEPETAYPFPWPFMKFFSIFPESVYMLPPKMKPLSISEDQDFDLIILAYQVWFLSPSLPTCGFLQSPQAAKLLKNKPVITLIACRDMWLMAQEKVKRELQRLQAHLIDNVALVDKGGSAFSFLSTPFWMFSGHRGPWGPVPQAGVAKEDIQNCDRFGQRIAEVLCSEQPQLDKSLLQGLGAVKIKEKTIASETMAHRSFLIWSKILMAVGNQDSRTRRMVLCVYIVFLITLILTVVPISALLKKIISPFTQARVAKQKQYYAFPSGEDRHLIQSSVNEQ